MPSKAEPLRALPQDSKEQHDRQGRQDRRDAATARANAAPVIHARRRLMDVVWNGLFVVVLILVYMLVVQNPRWEWPIVWKYLFHKRVLQGLENTIVLTILSSAIGLCFGCIVAACRMADNRALQAFGYCYIWIIRATPTLVMLLFLFFMSALVPRIHIPLPFTDTSLVDISTTTLISRYTAAVLGLSLYLGGYSAEIFRSGLVSIDRGQREAAKAIGMSDTAMMLHIIIPQAVRVIIPPLSNELITMFKNTSLVTVIGYVELLTTVQLIYSTNFETIPLLTVACIWYLVLTSLAMLFQGMLEKRFGKGFNR